VFEVSTIFDAKEVLERSALSESNQLTVSPASPAGSNEKSNSTNEKGTKVASCNRVSNRYRSRTAKRARRRLRAARKILHTTFPESRSKLLY
jgi:hypothetical protein